MPNYARMTNSQISEALSPLFGYAPFIGKQTALKALEATPEVQVRGEYGAVAVVWGDGHALWFDWVDARTICEACAVVEQHRRTPRHEKPSGQAPAYA